MRLLNLAAGAAFAGALAVAAPASAAIITTTFEGTIAYGFDQTGLFGAPGQELTGLRFKSVYTTNDTPGSIHGDDGSLTTVQGGTSYGSVDPVTAFLTIGSGTIFLGGDYYGGAERDDGENGYDEIENVAFPYLNQFGDGSYTYRDVANDVISHAGNMVTATTALRWSTL